MIRLVAIDLDDTLLDSDGELRPVTVAAVQAAPRVIVAMARPPRSVQRFYEQLGLDTLTINYNGALVHDPVRNEHLRHRALSPDLVREMIDAARTVHAECVVSLEILDRWYTDRLDETKGDLRGLYHGPDAIGPLEPFLNEPISKLLLLAAPQPMLKIKAVLEQRFGDRIFILPHETVLEIHDREANKQDALAWTAERYGVDREEVLAIGDGPADAEMLRWAGVGVAMGNACVEVLDIADQIVGDNDCDGVAQALERFAR